MLSRGKLRLVIFIRSVVAAWHGMLPTPEIPHSGDTILSVSLYFEPRHVRSDKLLPDV